VTASVDKRVEALGAFVCRPDVGRWCHTIAETAPRRRDEVLHQLTEADAGKSPESRWLNNALASLVGIVTDFGKDATLGAVEREADRVWQEKVASGGGKS
jgi:hypothetical protein